MNHPANVLQRDKVITLSKSFNLQVAELRLFYTDRDEKILGETVFYVGSNLLYNLVVDCDLNCYLLLGGLSFIFLLLGFLGIRIYLACHLNFRL